MWNDFKAFIMRGNVVDLAVAVVIGAAFGAIVKSLVDDIIMPPIGLLAGRLDFSNRFLVLRDGTTPHNPYTTVDEAHKGGAVTLNYGSFINNIITFLIIAAAVFMLVRIMNRLYAKPAPTTPTTRACPECTLPIPIPAKRCPNCTAVVALQEAGSDKERSGDLPMYNR
jgi:large conductance mechanosensitive channel